ncbi:unnamed protein product [Anisakis simplex]|uniref:Uncharacterized protein n=1 Tax=Anisakis simplex TaxID=6269 RepID=A0A0M3KG66_ANISI|nr:unnamed protein product [Anisakis simplex]
MTSSPSVSFSTSEKSTNPSSDSTAKGLTRYKSVPHGQQQQMDLDHRRGDHDEQSCEQLVRF